MFKAVYNKLHDKNSTLDREAIALLSGDYLKPKNPFKLLLISYLIKSAKIVDSAFKKIKK